MQNVPACPREVELQDLMLGALPNDRANTLGMHLLQCEGCADKVAKVPCSDVFLQSFRKSLLQNPKSYLSAPVARLIARMQEIDSEMSTNGHDSMKLTWDLVHDDRGVAGPRVVVSPPRPTSEPCRITGYRVIRMLGQGGMGTVFEAEELTLRRRVAIKVMRPEFAANGTAKARFLREAQAAAALDHDHIISIYQVGEEGEIPYLTMPVLRGTSLEDYLEKVSRPSVSLTLRVGREVAMGLAAAHAAGLIHRDIKPANIWLETMGPTGEVENTLRRVRILDFGLAHEVMAEKPLTTPGAVLGTPAYMAPEQAEGGKVDGRTDLFSLGCILYRMTTGRQPFAGETVMQVLKGLMLDDPLPPHQSCAGLPIALSELILCLLAKDSAKRPASAIDVVDRLANLERAAPSASIPATESKTSVKSVSWWSKWIANNK